LPACIMSVHPSICPFVPLSVFLAACLCVVKSLILLMSLRNFVSIILSVSFSLLLPAALLFQLQSSWKVWNHGK
jgi:hypothetical protein